VVLVAIMEEDNYGVARLAERIVAEFSGRFRKETVSAVRDKIISQDLDADLLLNMSDADMIDVFREAASWGIIRALRVSAHQSIAEAVPALEISASAPAMLEEASPVTSGTAAATRFSIPAEGLAGTRASPNICGEGCTLKGDRTDRNDRAGAASGAPNTFPSPSASLDSGSPQSLLGFQQLSAITLSSYASTNASTCDTGSEVAICDTVPLFGCTFLPSCMGTLDDDDGTFIDEADDFAVDATRSLLDGTRDASLPFSSASDIPHDYLSPEVAAEARSAENTRLASEDGSGGATFPKPATGRVDSARTPGGTAAKAFRRKFDAKLLECQQMIWDPSIPVCHESTAEDFRRTFDAHPSECRGRIWDPAVPVCHVSTALSADTGRATAAAIAAVALTDFVYGRNCTV